MKYNLQITEEQARIIQNSLDLYSRILIGQFEEIGNVLKWEATEWKDFDGNMVPWSNVHKFVDEIRLLKQQYMGMYSNGSHGIHSPHVSDRSRKAWDIQKVIRHKIAWDKADKDPKIDQRSSDMWGVNYDAPDKSSNDENYQLPTITKSEKQ